MGNPFTSPSISGYNSNPPPDDGTTTSANQLNWSKHKTKLADPVKTLAESTVTNTNAAFAKVVGGGGVTATAVDYTVLAGDQGKLIRQTGSNKTLTTPVAGTVGAPFVFAFTNDSATNMTLDGNGSETVNGSASVTIPAGKGGWCFTDGTNWFMAGQNLGVTSDAYSDEIVSTTGMVFYQASAPTGWTAVSSPDCDDYALKCVAAGGTGGTAGGTNTFSSKLNTTFNTGVDSLHDAYNIAAGGVSVSRENHTHPVVIDILHADVIICTRD